MIKENIGRSVKVKIRNEVLDGVIMDQCYDAGKRKYSIAVTLDPGRRIILRDVPGENVEILPDLRDLAEAYLREVDAEEICRLSNAVASKENELDATFKRRLDAMLPVLTERLKTPSPAPAPEDDVEVLIDPTPEQVPAGGAWGCWWDDEPTMLGQIGLIPKMPDKAAQVIKNCAWAHFAIIVRGYLGPCDLVDRVRKMLAEKEGK